MSPGTKNRIEVGARIVSGCHAPKCDYCGRRSIFEKYFGEDRVQICRGCGRDPYGKRKAKRSLRDSTVSRSVS